MESVIYVMKAAREPAGVTLNKLARSRYGNYRDASTVVNRLVQCGMVAEEIVRDHRQIPRVSFILTEKGMAALELFKDW
jgi:predicted transcriptional regulator